MCESDVCRIDLVTSFDILFSILSRLEIGRDTPLQMTSLTITKLPNVLRPPLPHLLLLLTTTPLRRCPSLAVGVVLTVPPFPLRQQTM